MAIEREMEGVWEEKDKFGTNIYYIKVIEPSQRLFLNFDPRSGGYEIRCSKMLPISRDRMSQQSNDSYSSKETRKISRALIFIHKKKRGEDREAMGDGILNICTTAYPSSR